VNYKRDEKLLIAFGQNIRRLRIERGLTMEALANEADMEIRQLGRIEGGQVNTTISTVQALAKALDIEMAALFQLKPKK
jgi:transcriptional regulator with XRE-family HTH domain